MFLTRSKTSSAINEDQYRFKDNDNMLPLIPDDVIPVLEMASPSIDSALNSILPENAKDLTMHMISSWIIASRIAANNNTTKPSKMISKSSPKRHSKPSILRSWTSRSFLTRSKTSVAPLQTRATHISHQSTINHYDLPLQQNKQQEQDRTPSLTASSTFTASSLSVCEERNESLHTPLLQDVDNERPPLSRLPVSLKSMIDLLDTPPLIPDQSSLSLIEETLTPMSSAFLEGHGHLIDSPCSSTEENATQFVTDTSSSNMEDAENADIVITASTSNSKSMRTSISGMISSLGLTMKKAFKMKASQSSSIVQLKKSLSIQRHSSTNRDLHQAMASHESTVSIAISLLHCFFFKKKMLTVSVLFIAIFKPITDFPFH